MEQTKNQGIVFKTILSFSQQNLKGPTSERTAECGRSQRVDRCPQPGGAWLLWNKEMICSRTDSVQKNPHKDVALEDTFHSSLDDVAGRETRP